MLERNLIVEGVRALNRSASGPANGFTAATVQASQARLDLSRARRPRNELRQRLAELDRLLAVIEDLLAADLAEVPARVGRDLEQMAGPVAVGSLMDCQEAVFAAQDQVLNQLIPWRAALLAEEEAAEQAA